MTNKYDDLFRSVGSGRDSSAQTIVAEFRSFAEQLQSLGYVDAEVLPTGSVENVFSLVTAPAGRKNERQHMLTFAVRPDRVEIVGPNPAVLRAPNEAEEYLREFGTSFEFSNTLQVYAARRREPFMATLRSGDWNELLSRDVVVLLSEEEHYGLVHSDVGAEVVVKGSLQEPPQLAPFVPGATYRYLDSSGFILQVESATSGPSKKSVSISGRRYEPTLL